MEKLIIKKTDETPAVIFIPEKGKFQLAGNSWPENADKFYRQIFEWLDEYFVDPLPETIFDLRLSYFNTASAKQITKLLLYLKEKSEMHKIKIRWFYQSEDYENFLEAERFRTLLGLEDIMEIKELDVTNPTE